MISTHFSVVQILVHHPIDGANLFDESGCVRFQVSVGAYSFWLFFSQTLKGFIAGLIKGNPFIRRYFLGGYVRGLVG